MKWLVGLDLRPSSQGAMKFAGWLSQVSKVAPTFVGTHVLEEEHLRAVLRYHHLDEIEKEALVAVRKAVEGAGLSAEIPDAEVVRSRYAAEGLIDAGNHHGVDGFIVGRQAKVDGHELVRLGRTARRILRALPGPVIVVPPDLEPSQMGSGPVIAVTKLTDDSAGSASFGEQVAVALGRDLVATHVVPFPEDYGAHYLPAATLERVRVEHQTEGERSLAEWAVRHGLGSAKRAVLQGPVLDRILEQARTLSAPIIVVGSRKLSPMERLLLTSVGSQLAAAAPCAVAVVPPTQS